MFAVACMILRGSDLGIKCDGRRGILMTNRWAECQEDGEESPDSGSLSSSHHKVPVAFSSPKVPAIFPAIKPHQHTTKTWCSV
jgi:hypothetical protein